MHCGPRFRDAGEPHALALDACVENPSFRRYAGLRLNPHARDRQEGFPRVAEDIDRVLLAGKILLKDVAILSRIARTSASESIARPPAPFSVAGLAKRGIRFPVVQTRLRKREVVFAAR